MTYEEPVSYETSFGKYRTYFDMCRDMRALIDAFYKNLYFDDSMEYGAPMLNPKRPFGNSCVESDILEIINWRMRGRDEYGPCYADYQYEYARWLYTEKLVPALRAIWNSMKDITHAVENPISGDIK